MSLGWQNKNPLNVKAPRDNYWRGQVGRDNRGHSIFKSHEFGWRAAIKTLRTYYHVHGLHSVRAIIGRWAPATDTIGSIPGAPMNSPSAYAKFVSRQMGVGVNDDLRLFDREGNIRDGQALRGLLRAMVVFECGHTYPFDAAEMEAGVRLYKGEEPKPAPKPAPEPEPQPEPETKSRWTRVKEWFGKNRRERVRPSRHRPGPRGRWMR